MKACVVCRTSNPADARFCANCGSSLVASCPRCGASLPGPAHFCPSCGAALPEGPRAGEERKLVTVLFADLTGSTGLGERLDPEHLKQVLDAYFAAMRREIEGEGGTVEKFIGDAVMGAFGVPVAHDDDPSRACRAALMMQDELQDLNESLGADYGLTLSMRVGINTGGVVAVSYPRPGEGMVTGDVVNVAARLEQSAQPGQILVSERTARAVRGFRLREMGPLPLRGKDQVVHVLELVGGEPHAEAVVSGFESPMVGRDEEMAVLRAFYQRVASESRPHFVTIYGEAGVGKSRLIDELLAWASALDERSAVARGRCLPYREGVMYWPLAEMLKSRCGVLDSDSSTVALEKIRSVTRGLLSPKLAAGVDRTTAALCFSVGFPDPGEAFDPSEPRQVRVEVFEAWRAYFSALARRAPTAVVVDDIHWADPSLLELLEQLADRVEGPVLFVCSARPELAGRRPGWGWGRWNFSSLLLEPLPRGESERLLDFLLSFQGSVPDLPDQIRVQILERAGGNPFFLEEIVRHLVEEKRLQADAVGGEPEGHMEAQEVQIPDTVQAVLAARMDALEPLEKRALQLAAVVGRVFWTGPLARLLDAERDEVDEVLRDRLADRGLILMPLGSTMAGEHEYAFKHVLTRDAAYESLPRRERATAHARVAAWMEESAGARQLEFGQVLAHHYGEAYRGMMANPKQDGQAIEEMRDKAFRFALLASGTARNQLALDKAERLAHSAMTLARDARERSEALEALGRACLLDFKGDEAWHALTEAIDLRVAADPEASADILRLCAVALEVATRARGTMRAVLSRTEAEPYLQIAMARLGDMESEESARILAFHSYWPWMFREEPEDPEAIDRARAVGERAADLAIKLGHPEIASVALDGVAQYYLRQGLYGRMGSLLERRLSFVPSIQDPWELGDIFATAAWAEFCTGRYRRAVALAAEGFERAGHGAVVQALHCLDWLALARCRLGDWPGFFEEAGRIAELLGDRSVQPPGFASDHFGAAALVHEIQGDSASADRLVQVLRWLEQTEERPSPVWMAWVSLVFARRGAFADARAMLRRIDEVAPGRGRGPRLEAWCDVACDEEAWDELNGVITESRRHADEAALLALPFYADRAEGRAALAAGDTRSAVELLSTSATGFSELSAEWEAARTRLHLSESLALAGEREAARRHLSQAIPVFDRLRSVAETARAADLLNRLE